MDAVERTAELALSRCRTCFAPDDRVRVFDLEASVEEGNVVVSGLVTAGSLREQALAAVETAVDRSVADEVTVLVADADERAVAEPVLSCHATPDPDAERVTQVLYGQVVTAFDRRDGWQRVRTPAGYLGWVPANGIVSRGEVTPDAVVDVASVSDPEPTLLSDVGPVERLYAGTPCERRGREGDRVEVAFTTGAEAALPSDAVSAPPADPDGGDVVETAATYLGTAYRWGGMTAEGIDCSGLVWMAYRRNGLVLPRDSDQQRAVGRTVERDDLASGDLLFFPGHVAISAGGKAVVHAARAAEGVVRASLDPDATADPETDDAGYSERLDEEFDCARRLL